MSRKALYAGSFDPITNGHIDIIKRAARIFESLTIGIIVNPNKNSLFTLAERIDIINNITADIDNINIESFDGLLADYVNENDFDVVIRGLRNSSDFDNEIQMAHVNSRLYKRADTLFLMTEPNNSFISSSLVKEVASLGGDVSGLVPEYVEDRLFDKYRRNI